MKTKLRNIFSSLMVVLFIGYYASSTLFFHTHDTTSGVVTHSHAFAGDATNHTHSTNSLRTIEHLSAIFFVLGAVAFSSILYFKELKSTTTENTASVAVPYFQQYFLRGPPSTM